MTSARSSHLCWLTRRGACRECGIHDLSAARKFAALQSADDHDETLKRKDFK